MTNVLVADKFETVGVDGLKDLGCDVVVRPDVKADALGALVKEVNPRILIVRSTKVLEPALAAGPALSLVIRAGAGIDNIDVAAASRLGIFVSNCPGKNSIAVAELVMGHLIALDRRIPDQVVDLRNGRWRRGEYSQSRGLFGRTLGIVGLGQIGREVSRRAQGFGMHVVGWSRNLTDEEADRLNVGYCQTPLEVARLSDAVSVHVAGTGETRHLVNQEFLAAMRPRAYLINASRGSVVDEEALTRAIRERGIRVALDVYQHEPGASEADFRPAILSESVVYGTHHVGASTEQAQVAIAHEVIRIVDAFLSTGRAPHCVNRLAKSTATHMVSVRHHNRPGVLAHVFRVLSEAGINVEEVENIAYHGAQAAAARIHISSRPSEQVFQEIRDGNRDIISVDVTAIE
ncbi:MAG: NAD(P)-dependent oxidoreductase [Gemmatimonadales bacterium]